jgi:signal transduction histidine kinase
MMGTTPGTPKKKRKSVALRRRASTALIGLITIVATSAAIYGGALQHLVDRLYILTNPIKQNLFPVPALADDVILADISSADIVSDDANRAEGADPILLRYAKRLLDNGARVVAVSGYRFIAENAEEVRTKPPYFDNILSATAFTFDAKNGRVGDELGALKDGVDIVQATYYCHSMIFNGLSGIYPSFLDKRNKLRSHSAIEALRIAKIPLPGEIEEMLSESRLKNLSSDPLLISFRKKPIPKNLSEVVENPEKYGVKNSIVVIGIHYNREAEYRSRETALLAMSISAIKEGWFATTASTNQLMLISAAVLAVVVLLTLMMLPRQDRGRDQFRHDLRYGAKYWLLLIVVGVVWVIATAVIFKFGRIYISPAPVLVGLLLYGLIGIGLKVWEGKQSLRRQVELLRNELAPQRWWLSVEPSTPTTPQPIGRWWWQITFDVLIRAIQALRQKQQYLQALLQQLPIGVVMVGDGGQILGMNERAQAQLGEKELSSPGTLATLLARVELKGAQIRERLADGRAWRGEAIAGNGLIMWAHYRPLEEGAGTLKGLLVLTDVSAQKRMEREREEALNFLSHDMRSPLIAIKALADVGQQQREDEMKLETLPKIKTLATQAESLANNYLSLSQLKETNIEKLKPVSLYEIFDELEFRLEQTSWRSLTHVDPDCFVQADRVALKRALSALLDTIATESKADDAELSVQMAMGSYTAITISVDDQRLAAKKTRQHGLASFLLHELARSHGGYFFDGTKDSRRHIRLYLQAA